MRYAIIIPDGAADEPLDELGGRTPLEAAHLPAMDEVASSGQVGTARTVPDAFESGSDVATMSLLGYDPAEFHTGRAPLEAAARGVVVGKDDWVFRCNLVTVEDGRMLDHSAGGIPDDEARQLVAELRRGVQVPGMAFHDGVSYRNLMTYQPGPHDGPMDVRTTPPHEVPGRPAAEHLPTGPGSELLRSVMTQSVRLFDHHPVNVARRAAGKRAATQAWFWGQGHPPALPAFADRFGVARGAMVTSVDLLRGLAVLLGWENVEVPGMTSFHDTDYAAQGAATVGALRTHDLVLSHVEAPDEASHQGDAQTKVASLEAIDEHVVRPVLEKLKSGGGPWRLLVLPDHPTHVRTRVHGRGPTVWAACGTGIAASGGTFDEPSAAKGKAFERGHDLMPWFLSPLPPGEG